MCRVDVRPVPAGGMLRANVRPVGTGGGAVRKAWPRRDQTRRDRTRRDRTRLLAGSGLLAAAVGCAGTSASDDSGPSVPVTVPMAAAPVEAAALDGPALRFKQALAEVGLAAGVPDETLVALVRGTCAQLAAGLPEDQVLGSVRPVAAFAASVSRAALQGDDAARFYVGAARETYC